MMKTASSPRKKSPPSICRGVEWAVLSACDTGVGEVRAGEGVFGLRRAFQVAGARTVIMSLWPVDDEDTRRWMTAYTNGDLPEAPARWKPCVNPAWSSCGAAGRPG